MDEWNEYHYIFEDKDIIQKLGLRGEIIVEFAKAGGKLKIATR